MIPYLTVFEVFSMSLVNGKSKVCSFEIFVNFTSIFTLQSFLRSRNINLKFHLILVKYCNQYNILNTYFYNPSEGRLGIITVENTLSQNNSSVKIAEISAVENFVRRKILSVENSGKFILICAQRYFTSYIYLNLVKF